MEIAALGCVCLTVDLLAHHSTVDPQAIAIVGSSYGGYLAAIATTLSPAPFSPR